MAEKKKSAFLISPIGSDDSEDRTFFDKVKRHLVEQVCTDSKFICKRADELPHPGTITTAITERLQEADLVIADLTTLNPNFFYELAIRHAVNKPVILIATKGTKIPFDVSTERVVFYSLDPDDLKAAKEKLSELIKTVDSKDYENDSPLKSKITIETTKSVDEKLLLMKMYEKVQEIGAVQARSLLEIDSPKDTQYQFRRSLLNTIERLGPVTSTELSSLLSRSDNITRMILSRLINENLVARTKESFIITKEGRIYLAHSRE